MVNEQSFEIDVLKSDRQCRISDRRPQVWKQIICYSLGVAMPVAHKVSWYLVRKNQISISFGVKSYGAKKRSHA